ncbi:ABC transporter ATP-binding protein [Gilvibacter sp.]|uniref:ABC transporter ATP-binding protein n=1 Tax=Gilvibacter sp. TaxID=2729997 RepID=UPI003F4A3951
MEEKEVLVKVEGASKKFSKDLKTGLKYGLSDLFTNVFGNSKSEQLRPKEFWAVQDVSFELRRGECLGLIGHNGAGKSTLLKMLNGLIRPDIGSITMKGRVGALIELGAGFNPILTGRENIYNNGAVLGFTKKEIDKKLEAIIAFAELEEFIDMPVQHYSSGMKVRLGFAVAAQMEPDILLIDEVLAVGDLGFVLKCLKTIDVIIPNTAIIFVSHSMPMVSRICNRVILLERGVAEQEVGVSATIDKYYGRFESNEQSEIFNDGSIAIRSGAVKSDKNEQGNPTLTWGDDLLIEVEVELLNIDYIPAISLIIFDKEQRPVAFLHDADAQKTSSSGKTVKISIKHEKLQLSKGLYSINLAFSEELGKGTLLRVNDFLKFQITHELDIWQPFLLDTSIDYEISE